jgi:chemotaxis protein MotB
MAMGRGSNRFSVIIWPGFVDVMTALILVLFFVLSIFMIVQFVLRDTITGQGQQLEELSVQVANLADALGLERSRADREAALVTTLTGEKQAAEARIASYEEQVASLIARNTDLSGELTAAQEESADRLTANQALEASLAQARTEIDRGAEEARLAAARREALEALVQSLKGDVAGKEQALSEAEATRLADAAAAEELRKRLEGSQAELTAMTLSLEAERKKAEETLTLLAAAEAAKKQLEDTRTTALTDAERRAAELAQAEALLSQEKAASAESQRQVALLNQQTASLRSQLDSLQGLLDDAEAKDAAAQVQIENLGSNLNAALARVAAEQKARADLEAEKRKNLESYRSEFFGQMRAILGEREGVQVVGDRFVFPSEVLFAPGSATLGPEGQAQVARVAAVIREIADQIPPDINWILRVDGHTDKTPVSPTSPFRDNWELSEARALSVVRYMAEVQGFPPDRLAATGFGEYQPIEAGDSPEALARNRRIELKFTER